jgi:histidine ammonia-lyase
MKAIRTAIPFLTEDRALKPDVDAAVEAVQSGELLAKVEEALGPLD